MNLRICRICGSQSGHTTYRVLELMFGAGELFSYFQCGSCRSLQIELIPENISKYYPEHYYSFSRPVAKQSIIRRASDTIKRARDRTVALGRAGKWLPGNEKMRYLGDLNLSSSSGILDVGCGSGGRLLYLQELGFSRLMGIDPFISKDIDHGNGVRVLKKSIHEVTGIWDVVMYHHSLEHVSDPLEQLRSATALLPRGGACIIRIPTVSSHAWEHYREYWYQIDAPRHIIIPSVEGMGILSQAAGLKLTKVRFDSTLEQFRISECYRKGVRFGETRGIFSSGQLSAWKKQARALNRRQMGDQAVFTMIKE